jgi:integrase
VQWLVDRYLAHLDAKAAAGLASHATAKQRRSLLTRLCVHRDGTGAAYGGLDIDLPPQAFVHVRDAWMHTPAEADNLMKGARAMYAWAIEQGYRQVNPVAGIAKIHSPGGGAKPWTPADLKQFLAKYPIGTTQHAWVSLCMFTACRLGDARVLGRRHEVEHAGVTWLEWQPGKRGSAPMTLPVMPALKRSLRALPVLGPTYLLTTRGKTFSSVNSLGNTVRDWCIDAGLKDRSSHGIRKATAGLLAEAGCSQHQIMAILAHTQAKTSEVYTRDAERRILAANAMQSMAGLEW